MKSRKQRPVNGPGANGLRGGTNLYSTKTTIARWLDDVGGPSAFKRGFNTPEFETEAQHQQCGATLKAPSYYGSELAKVDNTNKPVATVWETTARNMNTGVNKVQQLTYKYLFLMIREKQIRKLFRFDQAHTTFCSL
jgi:hypothetical protein